MHVMHVVQNRTEIQVVGYDQYVGEHEPQPPPHAHAQLLLYIPSAAAGPPGRMPSAVSPATLALDGGAAMMESR